MKKIFCKKNYILFMLIVLTNMFLCIMTVISYNQDISYKFNITSSGSDTIQVFNAKSLDTFNEINSTHYSDIKEVTPTLLPSTISTDTQYIRVDFKENKKSENIVTDFDIYKYQNHQNAMQSLKKNMILNQCKVEVQKNKFIITAEGNDPYVIFKLDETFIKQVLNNNTTMLVFMIIGICLFVDILLVLLLNYLYRNKFTKDIIKNRKLIWNLSKNDFKIKYAGSFFGVVWAFVQPVVTILLYWFVFQVGLRSGDVGEVPFVLWLMCGLVPWFFFQDAIMAITNSMIEYSFLVKKMVFQVEILPIVKIISALFVHLFFIAFTLLVFCLSGILPTFFALQLFYYLVCSVVLILGLGYATSALVLFFKDLSQIIQIVLQIGMWMTPILWNVEMLPKQFVWLMELNPMYYIVTGFRDSLINQTWFWTRLDMTLNFWLINIAFFAVGTFIFKKLKCHFADVL